MKKLVIVLLLAALATPVSATTLVTYRTTQGERVEKMCGTDGYYRFVIFEKDGGRRVEMYYENGEPVPCK